MTSKPTPEFWETYQKLPKDIRLLAVKAYRLWKDNHNHPSLHFKKLKGYEDQNVYSIRINQSWRAIGVVEDNVIYWQWIGHHNEYDGYIN